MKNQSSLYYHLIFVTKYRKKLLYNQDIRDILKIICYEVAHDLDINIVEIEVTIDHVHILFRSKITTDISIFIKILKGRSSYILKSKFNLKCNHLWSPSYYISTCGNVKIDIIKRYIKIQNI
jgi:putative transposase